MKLRLKREEEPNEGNIGKRLTRTKFRNVLLSHRPKRYSASKPLRRADLSKVLSWVHQGTAFT